MFTGWDVMDVLGWFLVVLAVLLFVAVVTYLVKAWTPKRHTPASNRMSRTRPVGFRHRD